MREIAKKNGQLYFLETGFGHFRPWHVFNWDWGIRVSGVLLDMVNASGGPQKHSDHWVRGAFTSHPFSIETNLGMLLGCWTRYILFFKRKWQTAAPPGLSPLSLPQGYWALSGFWEEISGQKERGVKTLRASAAQNGLISSERFSINPQYCILCTTRL